MKAAALFSLSLLSALAGGVAFAEKEESKITDRKVSIVGFVDGGQVVSGDLNGKPMDNAFLNRDGVALTYSGTINDNLHMNIGVGGLFWKAIPEADAQSKRILFGPGISEASANYDFTSNLNLKFGYFPYKYNPDATNLGEYLLRSEAYPSIVFSGGPGGWLWMNANNYKSMGAKLTWDLLGGALRQDLMIFSEFNNTPIFDFSPTYVATFKVGNALELGGGISLHRFLPIHPSVTTPTSPSNRYVQYANMPAVQWHADIDYVDASGALKTVPFSWSGNNQSPDSAFFAGDPNRKSIKAVKWTQLGSPAGMRDGVLTQLNQLTYCSDDACANSMAYLNPDGTQVLAFDASGTPILDTTGTNKQVAIQAVKTQQYTFKAIKLMGRASLNLGSILGMNEDGAGPFKLFGEVAVLGVQNQPYLYDKIQDRIPVMLGASIPTFGIFDLLSVQMEYFKNSLPDNNYNQFQEALPQPVFPSTEEVANNPASYAYQKSIGTYAKDDVKWSVFVKKSLFTGLDGFFQVANDHFRVQDVNAEPSYTPVTDKKGKWYYMFQFQWSM